MKKQLLLVFTALCFATSGIAQTQYYVSLSGSDSNPGTSAQPWKTIQHACDNATPNSVVNIMAGTYSERVEVNVSGTAGSPIVFRNKPGDAVVLDGGGNGTPEAIFGIFDQSYITVQGLRITNNVRLDAQGIVVEGNCQGIQILDNEVDNIHFSADPNETANASKNSQPIIVFGTNGSNPITGLVISGNTVRDSRTGYSEGLAVNGNVDGFEVSNNTLYGIANIGIAIIGHEGTSTNSATDQARNGIIKNNLVHDCISPYASAAGIYIDGGKDNVVEKNTSYQNQWGIEVGCENIGKTASGNVVRDNLIYANEDSGIALGGFDYPSGSGKVTDCTISNNTCFNNDTNSGGIGGVNGEINITYTENCSLENNIFYAANTADLLLFVDNVGSLNLNLDYNQFYISGAAEFEYQGSTYSSFVAYQAGTGKDAHSLFSDPAFENAAAANFHLTSSSPGINKGNPSFTAASGETDMDGGNRVQNGRVDMGAYEYSGVLPVEYLSPFRAVARATYIELKWVTAAEQRNGCFTVQRSADGRRWDSLFDVNGRGVSDAAEHYQAADSTPLHGLSYYRLRQMDFDGTIGYSNIAQVFWDSSWGEINIFPNPASEVAWLEIYNPKQQSHILEIYAASGKLILRKENILDEKIKLELAGLGNGIYIARVIGENGIVRTGRLVK